jgi:PKD repeat protein
MKPRFRKPVCVSLAVAAALTMGSLASAENRWLPTPERPLMPLLRMAGETRGEAAVQTLGSRLPQVAAHYRMSAERLRSILRRDMTARLDPGGYLFHEEPAAEEAGSVAAAGVSQAAPYDLSQTFLLASKPDSKRVIYLDFNGHNVSGTAWNGGAAISAQPYDTDGNPGSFSAAELEAIQNIWQRVAEDYAPFDVNVTTAEPPADAIARTSSSDVQYGTRVVITRNTFYDCYCGGVAYLGTFDYYNSTAPGYYQPAWIFFDALGNGYEKYVAEAASHEAGHNFGLSHDGRTNPSEGYYGGHGSGETAWAPIMGVGYSRSLTQWSKGEYLYANNTEDDLTIIPENGGPLRTDDAGDSITAASSLGGVSSNGRVLVDRSGLIGQRSDVDVFAFVAGSGTVHFDLAPAPLGPNLDIRADLLDGFGNLITSVNPADALGATLDVAVSGGTYFLRVDGVGRDDATTGYTDYASVGQYRITGSYGDIGALPPVAAFTALPASGAAPLPVTFDASLSSDADGSIRSYTWTFGDGTSATGLTAAHSYTSGGTYTATLTVTDNQGLSASKSMTITASATSAQRTVSIRSVSVTAAKLFNGYQCTAKVTVQDSRNAGLSGARVSGGWSGTVAGTSTVTTTSGGVATVRSVTTKSRGTCTFSVSNVSASGYVYDPSRNAQSSGSVTY